MPSTTPRQGKPERRGKRPVDLGDMDDIPAPSQQSQHGGAGGGREAARRTSPRMPKAQGAKAHTKSHTGEMLDKGVGKARAKQAKQRAAGRISRGELEERELPRKQPTRQGAKKQARAAKADGKANGAAAKKAPAKRAAAAAEAAPTQKQVLRDKPARARKLRDEGVTGSE
ncbi:MAG TPA: hypothetical protein VEA80_12320 [Vitreimonas sp.]|uniref:hypothetical protein n=1 Tax=Vitreimonas sp. TaxID=3069702 RepID=UPI002D5306D0|nr:hypothetical protein [Vitreimonas sp.]HYD88256.1 hypothetical protein [Vitreimonas sp.]